MNGVMGTLLEKMPFEQKYEKNSQLSAPRARAAAPYRPLLGFPLLVLCSESADCSWYLYLCLLTVLDYRSLQYPVQIYMKHKKKT